MNLRDIQYITSMFSLQITNDYHKLSSDDQAYVCFRIVHLKKIKKETLFSCGLFSFLVNISYGIFSNGDTFLTIKM